MRKTKSNLKVAIFNKAEQTKFPQKMIPRNVQTMSRFKKNCPDLSKYVQIRPIYTNQDTSIKINSMLCTKTKNKKEQQVTLMDQQETKFSFAPFNERNLVTCQSQPKYNLLPPSLFPTSHNDENHQSIRNTYKTDINRQDTRRLDIRRRQENCNHSTLQHPDSLMTNH